jgi:uncharacterized membrane protein
MGCLFLLPFGGKWCWKQQRSVTENVLYHGLRRA